MSRRLVCALWALVLTADPCGAEEAKPGARDAIEAAIEAAVEQALGEALHILPEGVDSIAIVALGNDDDGFVTDRVQYHAVRRSPGRAKVVARDDTTWRKLLREFEWSEKRFDIMAEGEVRQFGKQLGADALLYGWVRARGMDDSGFKGTASLTLYLGVVETGQIAGSGSGKAVVPIEAETFLLGLTQKAWFWPAVIGVVVGVILLRVFLLPFRRRMELAAKPRELVK